MAKALFHKSQRVFVKPIGIWAQIEQVVPHWVKDVGEPLKVTYDCGLGRPFQASELVSEQAMNAVDSAADEEDDVLLEHWQIQRRTIRWRNGSFGALPVNPGSFPVVSTDEGATNGWRVSGAEYDRDPQRVEHQARMIVHTPELLRVARCLAEFASQSPDALPAELKPVAQQCARILRSVYHLDAEEPVAAE